jgi:ATP-dependent Lhr-like helicase
MVLRIPDTESQPPSAELLISDPELLESVITDEVGSSALFAARFRENAARALLLPRRDPKSRSPLWQQRMRSAQLLTVAARYPEFPIVLETMRECLNDVFDLNGLLEVQRQLASRSVRIVEVETKEPSPFARSLLFGYVGAFVYEGDVPLAERKAAALSLDATLLAELLGKDGIKQLLDAGVIASIEADLQCLSADKQVTTPEQMFDLLRTAGPFTRSELTVRSVAWAGRRSSGRHPPRRSPRGRAPHCGSGDVGHRRGHITAPRRPRHTDPAGVAATFTEAAAHPIDDLVMRWARTHGPFVISSVAERYGLGRAVVESACDGLVNSGTLVAGSFVDMTG